MDSHSAALSDLFLSCYASICSTVAFHPLRNSHHAVVYFLSNSKGDTPFYCRTYDYSLADWAVFVMIIWEMFHGRMSLNLVLLLMLLTFVSGSRLELKCISLTEYQVKPHSSSGFSVACVSALAHRIHIFSFLPTEQFSWIQSKVLGTWSCQTCSC